MGGIVFLIYHSAYKKLYKTFIDSFLQLKHRGETFSDYVVYSNLDLDKKANMILSRSELMNYSPYTFIHGYHRNAINDLNIDGSQPFEDPIPHKILKFSELRNRPKRLLMCNGEIYNYNDLLKEEKFNDRDLQSKSDVEIIMPMYIKYGLEETLKKLNGDFSFVITENIQSYDLKTVNAYVVRDTFGTRSLYMIKSRDNSFYLFVSELKAIPTSILNNTNYIISEVPPGTYWSFQNSILNKNENEFVRYFNWDKYLISPDEFIYKKSDPQTLIDLSLSIRNKLELSIYSRYKLSDLPVGILLSGGFDSCIILSVLIHYLHSIQHDFKKSPLYVFTIGNLENNDVLFAQQCVNYLENKFEIDIYFHIINIHDTNIINQNINETIKSLETFDSKTIKTGLIFNILFKYIKEQTPVRVLLSGEGLKELCGMSSNVDTNAYQNSCLLAIENLSKHQFSYNDKLSSYYGLELRYPFLDNQFIELILNIHPDLRQPQIYELNKSKIEKFIIRKAFENEYLPYDILWNQSSSPCYAFPWMEEAIQNYCENLYTDNFFHTYLNTHFNSNINNKQDLHFKLVFDQLYPNCSRT